MTEHCHVTWANKMYNDCDGYIGKARAVFMDEKEKLQQQASGKNLNSESDRNTY